MSWPKHLIKWKKSRVGWEHPGAYEIKESLCVGVDRPSLEAPVKVFQNMSIASLHVLITGFDSAVRTSIDCNFKLTCLHHDLTECDSKEKLRKHIYFDGFPCRRLAQLRGQQGFKHTKGSGVSFLCIKDYIGKNSHAAYL